MRPFKIQRHWLSLLVLLYLELKTKYLFTASRCRGCKVGCSWLTYSAKTLSNALWAVWFWCVSWSPGSPQPPPLLLRVFLIYKLRGIGRDRDRCTRRRSRLGGGRAKVRTVVSPVQRGAVGDGREWQREGERKISAVGEGEWMAWSERQVSRPDLSCRKLFMSLNKMMLLLPMMENLCVCESVCVRVQQK